MTDTQSGPPGSETSTDERHACFLKSLIEVLKDNRDVLSSLPEMMEQSLDKEAQIPNLSEKENVKDKRNDDQERLAVRKQKDMEKQLESLQGDIDVKTQRIAALDQTIVEKTATIEALKSEQSTLMSTKDRKLMEKELKKRDKQLEASEKDIKLLEEEITTLDQTIKDKTATIEALKSEQNTKDRKSTEKELKNKDKQLEASEKRVKLLVEENLKFKSELEKKEKEKSETAKLQEEELAKKEDRLQRMYDEYKKALQEHKSRNDSLIKALDVKGEDIKVYTQSLSKMKDELSNAYAKMDQYKSRLASLSEKRVKQDQRLVEDTLGSNRQSELERDFSAFFDDDRLDACEKMQAIYQNKEDTFLYLYYPRLACIIFETAYEQVKEAKEAASDLFKELIGHIIDQAPQMGQLFSISRKLYREGQGYPICQVPINVSTVGDGAEYSKDVMDGMMLSLKEVAHTCNLEQFVNSVLKIAFEKWTKWFDEDKSCMFAPATHLVKDLDKYIKACIRLNWRMVTQVPPMKLEFHCSTLKKDIHKKMGYHNSHKMRSKSNRPSDQEQDEEIACYLWPGLQDGGGRLIRAGEVVCKVNEQ